MFEKGNASAPHEDDTDGYVRTLVRNHWLTILVGMVAFGYSLHVWLDVGWTLAPLSTRNIIRLLLITTFFILMVFGHYPLPKVFRITTLIVVPSTVVLVLYYMWTDIMGWSGLAREDRLIEDLSFLFLISGALCLVFVAVVLARRRERGATALAGAGSCVFFLIAMEEISWFQRVLELETGEFFLQRNVQEETNLHNMFTAQSEDIFYLGGFLLLVLLPYFKDSLCHFLRHIGLSSLEALLPPFWLITPFVLAGAFAARNSHTRWVVATITIGSIVILLGVLHKYYLQRAWWQFGLAATSFVLFLVTFVYLQRLNLTEIGLYSWRPKEYREFYIAWGVAVYGVSVVFQVFERDRKHKHPTDLRRH